MADPSDEELLDQLGVAPVAQKASAHSAVEERVIAGFEDIVRFREQHGRTPQHGEQRDIFERLYAIRLDRLRSLTQYHAILAPLDRHGLLAGSSEPPATEAPVDDSELLAQLGAGAASEGDIRQLKHVSTAEERRAAEEVANRQPCRDFAKFKPLFEKVQQQLDTGVRQTRPFELKAEIRPGSFFIVEGQKAYVAEVGEVFSNAQGRRDARLRVIFDNGTESNMLMRSLQRALHKDAAGRRITDPAAGPLFGSEPEQDDLASGTIYVLRSKSENPTVAAHRDLIHKIGVTGGKVETRIANAALDATYLLADVEVVATYKLFNIQRSKVENIIHRVFSPARLDLEIQDRFGNPVRPREWFLVPLTAIDEAVERIRDGSIVGYQYDASAARLTSAKSS